MAWYLKTGEAETLGQLTACELKRYLGELRDRDLADNTIHRFFEVLRALAGWADREVWCTAPSVSSICHRPGRSAQRPGGWAGAAPPSDLAEQTPGARRRHRARVGLQPTSHREVSSGSTWQRAWSRVGIRPNAP